ncbi:hypothetical protein AB205_0212530 [Aquarana catesbeiana]|uniref:UBX domain-containing protein n=1 Tax=Aquarana catesbeiana TaxID=8400 RepID=A0A2G9RX31_AQUCT|nr:hypothetical protein AB205_0212530 [Aquarana catesbeiana]
MAAPVRMHGNDVIEAPATHTADIREPGRKTSEDGRLVSGDSSLLEELHFKYKYIFRVHIYATPTVINKAVNGMEDAEQSFPAVELNDLEPSTNLKIWLTNGKRIVQKFNTSHRISDVRQFLESMPCKSEKLPFKLATSFPLCDILDETITIQEAHLNNAVLVQRLQKTTEPFRDS